MSTTTATGNTATQKQIQFIQRLQAERDLTGPAWVTMLDYMREQWRAGEFTKAEASSTIDALLTAPYKAKADTTPEAATVDQPVELEDGFYGLNGLIVKVQHGKESGRQYALVMEPGEQGERGSWVYGPGVVRDLTPAHRLTTEEAAAFGHVYGICGICGATLTDPESIERGIGPVCAGKLI